MARGWESKSVEQQQEAAAWNSHSHQRLTPEQISRQQRRRGLELSRSRILQQLERVASPQHRKMLEVALTDLDARLASES